MVQACPECILSPCLPISHYRKVGGSKNKEVTSLQGCLRHRCLPGRGWYFKPGRAHIFTPLSLPDLPFGGVKTLETTHRGQKRGALQLLLHNQIACSFHKKKNSADKKRKRRRPSQTEGLRIKARTEGRHSGEARGSQAELTLPQRRSCSCRPGQVPRLAGLALLLLHLLSFLLSLLLLLPLTINWTAVQWWTHRQSPWATQECIKNPAKWTSLP